MSSFLSALWIGEKLSIPAQDFFRKIDVGTSFSWSNRKARSEIPWVVKPYEGYYCVVLDFFLRCFGRPGRREHSKHSEIPIIHKCRQDIGLNVQMVPIRCAPEWYVTITKLCDLEHICYGISITSLQKSRMWHVRYSEERSSPSIQQQRLKLLSLIWSSRFECFS